MNDIIKAMRVLAEELDKQRKTEFMSSSMVLSALSQSLLVSADRLERESDDYGWVEHDGNGQPIPNGICVEVKSSSDLKSVGISESFFWYWNKRPSDIIFYRVINP